MGPLDGLLEKQSLLLMGLGLAKARFANLQQSRGKSYTQADLHLGLRPVSLFLNWCPDVASTLPTFSDYLAARRIDPRREYAVFDQWDRASRDFTHPECETARTLILRWLTWSDPICRNRAEVRNVSDFPLIEGYPSLGNNGPNRRGALEAARSDAQATEDA